MARKKRQHHEEHENHERWLVSYADFITLLFAFFVVMYAVSRVDNSRLVQVANSIKFALHFEGTGGVGELPIFQGPPNSSGCTVDMGRGGAMSPTERERAEKLRRKLENRLRPLLREQPAAAVILDTEGRRLTVRLSASRFFDGGEAVLHPRAMPVLDSIAAEVTPLGLPLRVEGHTDDRPTRTERFRNNWDLSAARASSVVSYLEEAHHVPRDRLAAVGLADSHPLGANDDEAGREANRRIDVVVEIPPGNPLGDVAH